MLKNRKTKLDPPVIVADPERNALLLFFFEE
jgi:hypothetical protein